MDKAAYSFLLSLASSCCWQVDNIPGVRGVGKKTAVTLLKKYDCIDGIYENVDDVGKYRRLDSCMRT